ncbi:hypothetical protein BCR44DRAFT_1094545 [Catenaria anguillulae PL171]|uniref:CREG-like beta-barrel domain-containing protein n=1 Tax=Catenaria anguillulae PL171 TaxID=765915 RepID=A0A1Y2H4G2_9FUNG|nr:hypothetical protein BCR44DRAFT_1094545 [Catenaria anguillulae PL171]
MTMIHSTHTHLASVLALLTGLPVALALAMGLVTAPTVAAERTKLEAAHAARRLLSRTGVADLATVMHSPNDPTLHGMPYSGPEYFASCLNTPFSADPLVFISPWSILTQNVLHRNGAATLSVRMLDPMPYYLSSSAAASSSDSDSFKDNGVDDVDQNPGNPVYTPMPYARMALVGHMRTIHMQTPEYDQGMRCFLSVHPDAQLWANMTTPQNHAFTLMQLHAQ